MKLILLLLLLFSTTIAGSYNTEIQTTMEPGYTLNDFELWFSSALVTIGERVVKVGAIVVAFFLIMAYLFLHKDQKALATLLLIFVIMMFLTYSESIV